MQRLRVIFRGHERLGDLGKARERTVQRVHPERNAACHAGGLANVAPLTLFEHFHLFGIVQHRAARLAHVERALGAVSIRHAVLLAGPLDLREFQLDVLAAVRTRHKIVTLHIRLFFRFPDVTGPQGRCGAHIDFTVAERLGSLGCKADRVGLLPAGSGVLVYLIEKQKTDRLRCQPARGV